jgi:hypothetical protein
VAVLTATFVSIAVKWEIRTQVYLLKPVTDFTEESLQNRNKTLSRVVLRHQNGEGGTRTLTS